MPKASDDVLKLPQKGYSRETGSIRYTTPSQKKRKKNENEIYEYYVYK